MPVYWDEIDKPRPAPPPPRRKPQERKMPPPPRRRAAYDAAVEAAAAKLAAEITQDIALAYRQLELRLTLIEQYQQQCRACWRPSDG